MIDVVVPAHNEQALIGACLRSVLADSAALDLRVIVVANGCSDDTATIARATPAGGQQVVVVQTPRSGKTAGLNAAEPHRRGCSVVYLDADTVLTPGTMPALITALDTAAARLVAPRAILVRPNSVLARSFAAVWTRLPAVAGQVIGGGCYAVNPAGRARWSTFPAVVADDAFVRTRFSADECQVVDDGTFILVLPEDRELVGVVRRWRDGNAELASSPSGGLSRNLRAVLSQPQLWPHLPGFACVIAAGRLRRPTCWARAERMRTVTSDVTGRPEVHVVVVTYCNLATIGRCLASLRSRRGELTVTVVDNASQDGTGDHVGRYHPGVRLIRNQLNVGFAAAVNQGACCGEGDYLLIVKPDVELDELAIDQLLTLADRFPQAGLYGGRGVDETGGPIQTTCPVRRRHDDVRAVPVLTTPFLLVDMQLWFRLGGFNERVESYGQDVDLCVRATDLGATPMLTPLACHRSAAGRQPPSR